MEKVRGVALEGEQKIREKAEKWIEDNWIEQNILEAAALGRHCYFIKKAPREFSAQIRNYFGERGFDAFVLPVPLRGTDDGTSTVEITW